MAAANLADRGLLVGSLARASKRSPAGERRCGRHPEPSRFAAYMLRRSRAMSKTRVDDSRWPLVVCTAVGEQTGEDLEAFLSHSEGLLRRREPHGTIFDARRLVPWGPKLRKRVVQWLVRNDAMLRTYVVASGIVMSTPLQRGALRAITWMRPLPFPYCTESSLEAARHFVCSRLAQRGCVLPAPLEWSHLFDVRLVEKSRDVDTG
jgi:hypothetical protein